MSGKQAFDNHDHMILTDSDDHMRHRVSRLTITAFGVMYVVEVTSLKGFFSLRVECPPASGCQGYSNNNGSELLKPRVIHKSCHFRGLLRPYFLGLGLLVRYI